MSNNNTNSLINASGGVKGTIKQARSTFNSWDLFVSPNWVLATMTTALDDTWPEAKL